MASRITLNKFRIGQQAQQSPATMVCVCEWGYALSRFVTVMLLPWPHVTAK